MGEVVDMMKGQPARAEDNAELIADLCRFAEKILTEEQVKKKHHLVTDATWDALADDAALLEKVELEKVRRIRNGSSKREKAQLLVVQAPDVAAAIMNDKDANNRHRLDACSVLNNFAGTEREAAPATDLFQITINLGDHVETYSKTIAINVDDTGSSNGIATAPTQATIKAIEQKPCELSPEEIALQSLMRIE